jgi:repressor LexA
MGEELLSQKAREALRHIRTWVMNNGRIPSVRELMREMEYKSSRSALLLMDELLDNGFLQKKDDGGLILIKDLESENSARTVAVPLVGSVACGIPLFAEENVEALIPVSISLAKPGSKYFFLKASGDSMDKAGINDGDFILVKQQYMAENGQDIVALIDDEVTVKEFRRSGEIVTLLPKSTNPKHQKIIVSHDFKIQGIVIAVVPK